MPAPNTMNFGGVDLVVNEGGISRADNTPWSASLDPGTWEMRGTDWGSVVQALKAGDYSPLGKDLAPYGKEILDWQNQVAKSEEESGKYAGNWFSSGSWVPGAIIALGTMGAGGLLGAGAEVGTLAAEEAALTGGWGSTATANAGMAGFGGVEAVEAAAPGSITKGLTTAEEAASVFNPSYAGPLSTVSPGTSFDAARSLSNFASPEVTNLVPQVGSNLTGGEGFFSGLSNFMSSPLNAAKSLFSSNTISPSGGGSNPAGFGWGNALSALTSIGSGLYGMDLMKKQKKLAADNAAMIRDAVMGAGATADPWGTSGGRSSAAQMLMAMQADPSGEMAKDPRFAAMVRAARRSTAPAGEGSGAMAIAAANAGGNWFTQRQAELANLAGVGNAGIPVSGLTSAAQIALTGNQGADDLASRSLASIGYGVNTATGGGAMQNIPPAVINWMRQNGMRI